MTNSQGATSMNIPPGNPDDIVLIKCDDILPSPCKKPGVYSDSELSSAARMFLKHGVGIPLIVSEIRVFNRNKYLLVCGEKIFRAALVAKLDKLPCKVFSSKLDSVENQTDSDNVISETVSAPPLKPNRIVIKDSRFFFNSVNHAIKLMNESGISITSSQTEMPEGTVIKIIVPKSPY